MAPSQFPVCPRGRTHADLPLDGTMDKPRRLVGRWRFQWKRQRSERSQQRASRSTRSEYLDAVPPPAPASMPTRFFTQVDIAAQRLANCRRFCVGRAQPCFGTGLWSSHTGRCAGYLWLPASALSRSSERSWKVRGLGEGMGVGGVCRH